MMPPCLCRSVPLLQHGLGEPQSSRLPLSLMECPSLARSRTASSAVGLLSWEGLLQTQVADTRQQNGLGVYGHRRKANWEGQAQWKSRAPTPCSITAQQSHSCAPFHTFVCHLGTFSNLSYSKHHKLVAILAPQERRDTLLSSGLQPTPLLASINFLPAAETTSSPSQARVRLPCTRRKDFTTALAPPAFTAFRRSGNPSATSTNTVTRELDWANPS